MQARAERERDSAKPHETARSHKQKMLKRKDLLGIEDLSRDEILEILDTAESFQEVSTRPIKKVPTLRGKTVINLFFEASTRTRPSFKLPPNRLSAHALTTSPPPRNPS